MPFADLSAKLSIQSGSELELNSEESRVQLFRAKAGYAPSSPWASFSRDDRGSV
jgi:hypothetical protein